MAFGEKRGFFSRLTDKLGEVMFDRPTIDDDFLDELEEVLITSDIGMDTTMTMTEKLRENVKENKLYSPEQVRRNLRSIIVELIDKGERHKLSEDYPLVIMVIGVNGGGKTTTIGKLAYKLKNQGHSVMLAAADTFRAAAADQLQIWADRVGVNMVRHEEGADPAAVIYDAIQSAKAKGIDILICDTAGRLQNKKNLMAELEKMNRIISREYPEASRETLLVLDATTGKNAISQAEEFGTVADITGLVLTKLDGTAKGGIVVTIADQYDMAVKYIGVGEKIEDLEEFVPKEFASEIAEEE